MTIKVYLAARYTRREEMAEYAERIAELDGFENVARWVFGAEEGMSREDISDLDLEDVDLADVVISFTEPYGTEHRSGGRHVEFGYALGRGKVVILIGDRENVFHHDRRVYQFDSYEQFVDNIPNIDFTPTITTLNQYQLAALNTKLPMPIFYPALKLAGEAGEVAEKVSQIYRDHRGAVSQDDNRELIKKCGAVMRCLASIADELWCDLETVANISID